MTRESADRLTSPKAPAVKRAAHEPLGQWNGDRFDFATPAHEREWHGQAYRQSVRPDRWQAQAPVDSRTQSLLDQMPHLGAGQFFRGPDGKHRPLTADQRETPEVQAIRRIAFNDYAKTGITWSELGQRPEDEPHPGETAAVALMQAKAPVGQPAETKAIAGQSSPNKKRDTGELPSTQQTVTRVTGDLDLSLAQLEDPWGAKPAAAEQPPILVASNDKAGTVPAWLKGFTEPEPVAPARPLPGSQQRRAYNERLVGKPANDNSRRAANDNRGLAPTEGKVVTVGKTETESGAKPRTGAGSETETDSDAAITDRLFNWSRKGLPRPAPSEFAIHAASDEDRFTYLEEMKDEWSRQLGTNPEKVFRSMQGEVDKLANAAQQDFVTSYHQDPTAANVAEIVDAVTNIVFAPAEHWTVSGKGPHSAEVAPKPYIALEQPKILTGNETVDLFKQAAVVIAQEEKFGGRSGNLVNRKDIALIAEKLAAAIKACGGNVKTELYGSKEPQVQYVRKQVKGSRYPDVGTPFEINGKTVSPFVTHYDARADGVTMTTREDGQLQGLVKNLARAIYQNDFGIDAAGIGAIPKRKKNQTDEEYHKMIDDLVKKMIDCRRPFLIKLDIDPLDIEADLD